MQGRRGPDDPGFGLKPLTRPTLDLSLATAPGLTTRIIERPGAVLDDPALAALVEQLRTVAGRTLDQGALSYGVFSGERERLSQSIVTLISETASGKPVAFNALAQMQLSLDGEGAAPAALVRNGICRHEFPARPCTRVQQSDPETYDVSGG